MALRVRHTSRAAASALGVMCALGSAAAQTRPLIALRPGVELSEPFTRVAGVRELADGRTLVLDGAEQRLVVADFRMGRVEEIGRKGDGPGEYRRIDGIWALPGDSTLVEDRGGRRWIFLLGTRAVATVTTAPNGKLIALAGLDRNGRLLDIQGFAFRRSPGVPYTPMRVSAESLLILVRERQHSADATTGGPGRLTNRLDTIARLRGTARGQTIAWRSAPPHFKAPIRWLLENPLHAEEQALLFPDGWIALVFAEPYRVEWITPDGRRVRGPSITDPAVPVDNRLKKAILEWRWPGVTPPFTDAELPEWPKHLPPFLNGALLAAPDGRLVVRRTYNPSVGRVEYDLIDRAGVRVGRMELPKNERMVGFGPKAAYAVVKDADDVETLRRHPWP